MNRSRSRLDRLHNTAVQCVQGRWLLIDALLDLLENIALLQGSLSLPVEVEAVPGVVAFHVDDVREALLLLSRVGHGRRTVNNTRVGHLRQCVQL